MRYLLILSIAVFVINYLPVSATIINIPGDYVTIQAGIDASSDGDTVLVQPETYYENINFNGHNIMLGSLFLITGERDYIEQTIIDGDSSGTVIKIENGEDDSAVITGFTLTNGFAQSGGGIYCSNTSPLIANNIITDNKAWGGDQSWGKGGGIYCIDNASPVITDNEICLNYAQSWTGGGLGGGIYCLYSNLLIENNHLYDNWVSGTGLGGALYCSDSNVEICDNIIMTNSSSSSGGGIYCSFSQILIKNSLIRGNISGNGAGAYGSSSSNLVITNSIIEGNHAQYRGGGIGIVRSSNCELINDIIYDNFSAWIGGGLYLADTSVIEAVNSILWADSISDENSEIYFNDLSFIQIDYSDIQGGWEGEGNINIDPLFRDPESGDLHLMATYCGDPYDSPCIDMGHPDIADSLLDCNWGLGEFRSDIGAYGGRGVDVNIDEPENVLPKRISIFQNYPNPFNASTMIRYELPEQAQVKLAIYDILGRKVTTIEDGSRPAGYHQVLWKADAVASGIYFYRLQAGDIINTRKMLLVK